VSLHIRNDTPFPAHAFQAVDGTGAASDVLVVKGSFTLSGAALQPAEAQRGIRLAPVHVPLESLPLSKDQRRAIEGRESWAWLCEDTDLVPPKPRFDVLVNALAAAPDGRPQPRIDCEVRAFGRRLRLWAWGPRVWLGPRTLSAPIPVTQVPVIRPFAYGGMQANADGSLEGDDRNVFGLGHGGRDGPGKHSAAPWIEAPEHAVKTLRDRPEPCALGLVPAEALPRRRHAGSFDDAWRATRSPLPPRDFDPRYYNAAPEALQFDSAPRIGDRVDLIRLCSHGDATFQWPAVRVLAWVDAEGGARQQHELRCDTLLLEPETDTAVLTWRLQLPLLPLQARRRTALVKVQSA